MTEPAKYVNSLTSDQRAALNFNMTDKFCKMTICLFRRIISIFVIKLKNNFL